MPAPVPAQALVAQPNVAEVVHQAESAPAATPDRQLQAGAAVQPAGSSPAPTQQPAAALDDAALADIYGRVDRNHDGRITRAELIKTVRSDAGVRAVLGLPQHIGEDQRPQLEAVFQGMDVDGSRGVDFNEFAAYMGSPRMVPRPALSFVMHAGEIALR